jgi:alcohol dehydrogenase class IV
MAIEGHALLVTDETLFGLGISDKIKQALFKLGIKVTEFYNVEPEPEARTVRKLLDFVKEENISVVIGLGGGSPMDVAKIVALLISQPQQITSMYGVGNALGNRLPLVLIPTTAGTGSEGTPVAVITGDDGEKSPIVGPQFVCDHVILDAELTTGLPPNVTSATGIDAMVHAIEAYTSSVRKNPVSDHLAIHGLQLLYGNIRKVLDKGEDIEARGKMLLGSMMSGIAFANSTVGAVHALAYPLGTQFKLSHGESNAVVLPPVMKYNLANASKLYAELWNSISTEGFLQEKEASDRLIRELKTLIREIGLKDRLSHYGIKEGDLDSLTRGAMKQARLLSYNIKPLGENEIHGIFKSIL